MNGLKPEAWALLFDVMNKAAEDSEECKTLSRFARTTFYQVNYDRFMVLTVDFFMKFLRDTMNLLTLAKNDTAEVETSLLLEIVRRFPIVVYITIHQRDFSEYLKLVFEFSSFRFLEIFN